MAPATAETTIISHNGEVLYVQVWDGWEAYFENVLELVYEATFDTSGAQQVIKSVTGSCTSHATG